jgi:cytochrome d ubiquinol oxidase subunit I
MAGWLLAAADLPSHSPVHDLLWARVAIGGVLTVHIVTSGLISGAGQLGPVVEYLGYMRQRRRYDRLAHGLARMMVWYFALSSTLAILLVSVLLVGIWGHFWTSLSRVTFWPLFAEAVTFVFEVALTYLWYYSWEPLRAYKKLHMALGGLLAMASFLQVLMINIVAAYMLTPVPPQDLLRVVLNPTVYPLQLHRTVGNMAYLGFAIAAFSAFRWKRARDAEDRAFYDWAGSFGMLWGIALTLLQPIVGYSYAKEIQLHAYNAWYKMMMGGLSAVFLWQMLLFGLMMVVAVLYFTRRLRTARAPGARTLQAFTAGLVLTTLLAAMPYHLAPTLADVQAAGRDRPFWQGGLINPLGAMIPWKVLALMSFTILAVAAVVWYLRGIRDMAWGNPGRAERRLLLASLPLTVAMIATMGFIREDGRVPYLVTGSMTMQGQSDTTLTTVEPQTAPPP